MKTSRWNPQVRQGGWLLAGLIPLSVLSAGADSCTDKTSMVPMRDGITLATDVYQPRGGAEAPTILARTPYLKEGLEDIGNSLALSGYNFVAQDMRGFGESGGEFMMFTDDGWGVRQDGYDTLAWVDGQSWGNGNVCMYGGSALAISALMAAGSTPPGLKCVYSLVGSGELYAHVNYWGGALREEMVVNWLQALGATAALEAVWDHPMDDAFWDPVTLHERYPAVQAAVYSVGGWYDIFSQSTLDAFSGLESAGGPGAAGVQKLMIGPWSHGSAGPTVGELTFPDNSIMAGGEEMRWFDYWLKGSENGILSESPVKYYLMGDVDTPSDRWNVWKTADAWPIPATPTSLYLLPGGEAGFVASAESEARSSFVFDPANPVPTVCGNNLVLAAGPCDQRSIETRPDVLTFSTPPLETPVGITGKVVATLYVSSSALDTDFTVKLTDVYPDGRSILLLDGIQRMRFRDGFTQEQLMVPGEVYPVEVELWSTAHVFNAGHQIRVAVSSSNAPRFDVNPNTGESLTEESGALVVATQSLYHDAARPSRVELPVVDF